MLEEENLRLAALVVEILLRVLAFLAAEGRIGEDVVELRRRAREKVAIGFRPRQGIAVPDARQVNAVQDHVGQAMGIASVASSRAHKRFGFQLPESA